MRPHPWVVVLAAVPLAMAQQGVPHAGYVYPAGGRQGTTFEVIVGGQFLSGVHGAYVSGEGVQAKVVEYDRPLTPAQVNMLREQLQALMPLKPEDRPKAAEIREKIATFVRRTANPVLSEKVRIEINVTADAAPGARELRLATPAGLTSPLVFCIGQLPEYVKKVESPQDITLPLVVNGQMKPGGVDRYRFRASKGQHLVIAAAARELMPYISDAVPGWFQAALALRNAGGREVAYADHYRFRQDPVLFYDVTEDGLYELDIRDSIYRGRDDFVYRIELGELPFVTSIFPLGGKAGGRTTVGLTGWNLPVAKVTENAKGRGRGLETVAVRKGRVVSNAAPFALETLPETMEKDPHDGPRKAQRVKLPIIVNGRIDRAGERDVFRFQGRAGEEIVAEVFARRLDSPLDSVLRLMDAAGKELASNDDCEDKGAGLITHQADSRIQFKLHARGTYYIELGDTQGQGGAEYSYRLRISHPQPDFELRVVPSSINARGGATVPIAVYALRRDGFGAEIRLQLKDAPVGFTLAGTVIPANAAQIRLTLTAPQSRTEKPVRLTLEGTAMIEGREVHRMGMPADDMMQAFAYHHLAPAKELLVQVAGQARSIAQWRPFRGESVKIPAGGTAAMQLFVPAQLAQQVQVALNEPPDGISIASVTPDRDGIAVTLRAEAAKVKPGLKGNLILDAFTERIMNPAGGTAAVRRRQPIGTLPAIPFEIGVAQVSGTVLSRAPAH